MRRPASDEVDRKRYAVQIQEAKLAQAQADVESAAAQVKSTEIELDRRLVKSPVDGEVLQVKIRLGEYAPAAFCLVPTLPARRPGARESGRHRARSCRGRAGSAASCRRC